MLIESGSKIVFIGDSITDAGRSRPAGEGLFNALGTGYVAQVDALIGATDPSARLRVVNRGTSGNTVLDLKDRWQEDVLDLQPQWLVVMIGINDVWRQFDCPLQNWGVALDTYRETLDDLIAQAKPGLTGLVLMTPFVIEKSKDDAMRAAMDQYGAVVRELATKYDAVYVDTQAAMDAALEHNHPTYYAWDRIHPTQTGTMIIARAFLRAVQFSL
jgi:lysophospholipase L1-like esterase